MCFLACPSKFSAGANIYAGVVGGCCIALVSEELSGLRFSRIASLEVLMAGLQNYYCNRRIIALC
jgi:hypothetical protein